MIPGEITCVGCGVSIPVDPEDDRWSVRTELVNGVESVVERHLSILCPSCGRSEVRNNFDPYAVDGGDLPARLFNLVVVPVDPPEPL